MIIAIITLIFLILTIWLFVKLESFGFATLFLTIVLIIMHNQYYLKGYNYNKLVIEKNTIEETLKFSRKNEINLESVGIVNEINRFNKKLNKLKYKNTTFWFDQYIDDRIMKLKPIK